MATLPSPLDESARELEFPQREAAFFYGLFLRGHPAEELRKDIGVPSSILEKWDRETTQEPALRAFFERIVEYRRHVLAIFDSLIGHDRTPKHLQ